MTDTRDDLPEPGKKFEELLDPAGKGAGLPETERIRPSSSELVEKNPVTAYRFGSRIDENFV